MYGTVRKTNSFFRNATRKDIERLQGCVFLTERQEQIFNMFYLKKKDVNFIADTLNYSPYTINKELRKIRDKIVLFL